MVELHEFLQGYKAKLKKWSFFFLDSPLGGALRAPLRAHPTKMKDGKKYALILGIGCIAAPFYQEKARALFRPNSRELGRPPRGRPPPPLSHLLSSEEETGAASTLNSLSKPIRAQHD